VCSGRGRRPGERAGGAEPARPGDPHRGGELLDEKFGDRSRLVSVDGSGHGVYVLGDNACALNTTTSFLVDGTLPKRGMSRP